MDKIRKIDYLYGVLVVAVILLTAHLEAVLC
jgi:hypothetical protein